MSFRKILHIDDDNDDCELTSEAFKIFSSVSYIAVNNPIEALHKLRTKLLTPDLILLDLNMPVMDGLEVLKLLKSSIGIKEIPVIIFSTSAQKDVVRRTIDSGAMDYIVKPNSFNGFKDIVRRLV